MMCTCGHTIEDHEDDRGVVGECRSDESCPCPYFEADDLEDGADL